MRLDRALWEAIGVAGNRIAAIVLSTRFGRRPKHAVRSRIGPFNRSQAETWRRKPRRQGSPAWPTRAYQAWAAGWPNWQKVNVTLDLAQNSATLATLAKESSAAPRRASSAQSRAPGAPAQPAAFENGGSDRPNQRQPREGWRSVVPVRAAVAPASGGTPTSSSGAGRGHARRVRRSVWCVCRRHQALRPRRGRWVARPWNCGTLARAVGVNPAIRVGDQPAETASMVNLPNRCAGVDGGVPCGPLVLSLSATPKQRLLRPCVTVALLSSSEMAAKVSSPSCPQGSARWRWPMWRPSSSIPKGGELSAVS